MVRVETSNIIYLRRVEEHRQRLRSKLEEERRKHEGENASLLEFLPEKAET